MHGVPESDALRACRVPSAQVRVVDGTAEAPTAWTAQGFAALGHLSWELTVPPSRWTAVVLMDATRATAVILPATEQPGVGPSLLTCLPGLGLVSTSSGVGPLGPRIGKLSLPWPRQVPFPPHHPPSRLWAEHVETTDPGALLASHRALLAQAGEARKADWLAALNHALLPYRRVSRVMGLVFAAAGIAAWALWPRALPAPPTDASLAASVSGLLALWHRSFAPMAALFLIPVAGGLGFELAVLGPWRDRRVRAALASWPRIPRLDA